MEGSRDSDIPVRDGGKELAVFLSVHSLDSRAFRRVRIAAYIRHHFEKWSLRVTVSAGELGDNFDPPIAFNRARRSPLRPSTRGAIAGGYSAASEI